MTFLRNLANIKQFATRASGVATVSGRRTILTNHDQQVPRVDPDDMLQQTEQQLLQSQKLATLGQLMAGLAHEINNPISYVHSNLGTLRRHLEDLFQLFDATQGAVRPTAPDGQDPRLSTLRAEMLHILDQSLEGMVRMRDIVQDLKAFSRMDAHDNWVRADLHHGLDSTLNLVNNEIKDKAAVVKAYGSLPVIECLPGQLNQVFMNLILNAAQAFGEQRGKITVRSGRGADDTVWVEVADNAGGIAPEHLSQVFAPFFTTKAIGKGTGLGLSLAEAIVHRHQGRILVASTLGQGSTFHVSLPIHQRRQ